jgi:D-3-phosphoglycerate dehydrogenase
VGDSYLPSAVFAASFAALAQTHKIDYVDIPPAAPGRAVSESEQRLREYIGAPEWLAAALAEAPYDVLVVHGAPVTDQVLASASTMRLVCCARGGPVNIDLEQTRVRGVAVTTTPGKNADAVADLTIAFMIMLTRRLPYAIESAKASGVGASTFEGADYIGGELGGSRLGLVGYGNVGRRVAQRAQAFGMDVAAYDPYLARGAATDSVAFVELAELLRTADFVSLHARATAENRHMFGATQFRTMKDSAYFVNTARETLVDEAALVEALVTPTIAGAALDVIEPTQHGEISVFATLANAIVTPHIGGATHETLARGAAMIADEIDRFAAGRPLKFAATA